MAGVLKGLRVKILLKFTYLWHDSTEDEHKDEQRGKNSNTNSSAVVEQNISENKYQ